MNENRLESVIKRILPFAPLAWLFLFAFFVIRAWLKIGYMPSYANPDPKNLNMILHHILLWLFLYAIPWLILAYTLTGLLKKVSSLKILVLFVVVSLSLFFILGPHTVLWPAIWMIPVISIFSLLTEILSKKFNRVHIFGLIAINTFLFVDPFRLLEWFYD